ncbi:MAG: hypothetical protein V4649_03145 [Bacteroidota bacterium]
MKTIYLSIVRWCTALMLIVVTQVHAIAQEGGTDSKVSVSSSSSSTSDGAVTTWYAAPWVWIVGAAVFILLLVAIVRGRGRRAD